MGTSVKFLSLAATLIMVFGCGQTSSNLQGTEVGNGNKPKTDSEEENTTSNNKMQSSTPAQPTAAGVPDIAAGNSVLAPLPFRSILSRILLNTCASPFAALQTSSLRMTAPSAEGTMVVAIQSQGSETVVGIDAEAPLFLTTLLDHAVVVRDIAGQIRASDWLCSDQQQISTPGQTTVSVILTLRSDATQSVQLNWTEIPTSSGGKTLSNLTVRYQGGVTTSFVIVP